MSNNFLTSTLGFLEKKNIFFPNGINICHTCNKPIIERKINLNNFSLYHQNMICMGHLNHSHLTSPANVFQDDVSGVDAAQTIPGVESFEAPLTDEVIDEGIDPLEGAAFPQATDSAHIDHSELNPQDPDSKYVTKEEFVMYVNVVNQGIEQVNENLSQINQNIIGLRQDINKLNKNMKNIDALTQFVNNLKGRIDVIENYVKVLEGIKGLEIEK